MPVIFETSNIDEVAYEKLIRRQIYINLGITEGRAFLDRWNIVVYPLEAATEFVQFFEHVEGETSAGIAWGISMPKTGGRGGDIYNFVNDTKNPFILRSNFTKISHENGHALCWYKLGTSRCVRKFDEPGARAGSQGPCYVTKVHDQFYGAKKFRTYWVRYGLIWLPVRMLDIYSILH